MVASFALENQREINTPDTASVPPIVALLASGRRLLDRALSPAFCRVEGAMARRSRDTPPKRSPAIGWGRFLYFSA
jgi:hypothetical protein